VPIEPKEIHSLTKKVMDGIGIDISGQYSKSLKDNMGKIHFGYLITVCSEADANCLPSFTDLSQGFGGIWKTQ
jgi:arsenate reductase (thioredoxin)